MSEDEVGNINTGTEMEMEEKSGKKCWSRPLSKESLLPPGFLPGAGAFDVAVSGAPSANCACCAALRAAEAAHPAGAGGGNRAVLATLDSAGDAMGFWVGNTEDAEPRTHVLVSVASLRELGCDRGIGIEALSELARRNKLTYSACVAAGTHHADGGGASSSTAAAPCRHVITFTVHLSLVFFDSRQTAEEASSQRWLRRLLSTFTTRLAAQSRGSVEQHEIDCMRNAAQRLGMSMREDAGLNAFLYMPLLPNQAQSLASKFRLEHVLDSILQSSYSTPQSCGDAAVDLSPSADVKVEKGHLDSKGKGPADDKGKGPATSSCSLHRRVGLAVDRLPEDALVNMLELLEPLQLDIVSLVCKSMHAAAHICIPGLKLQLYKHQRRAMEWMMLRERPARTVVWNPLVTKFTTANGTDYFLASKATGAALTLDSHTNTEVEDIRGGLLCDEPGMGKTITVLALILKTRRPLADRKLPPATWVGEASGSHRTFPHTAKSEQKVKLNNQEHQMSIDCCEAAVLPPTLSNKRFRFFLAAPDGDACQSGFTWSHTSLIPATPRAATQASPARLRSDSSAMSASLAVSEMGSSGGLRRSRRSSGSLSTPLLRRSCPSLQGDNNGMSSLHVSSSTLIVVPATLIDHWKFQITQHTRDGVLSVLAVNKPSEMLPAALMAKYDVVLTTFDVLSKEWAIASPSPGSDRWYKLHGTVGRGTQSWRFSPGDYKGVGADAQSRASSSSLHAAESSELLLVRWQRVILDEGHVMGASCDTNRALMLASIVAGARWICTGTPAPSTPAAELQHMYGLITALAVQPYTNPDTWRSLIHAPFESQNAMAWMRLHVLLDRVMIRAVKADMVRLGEIPTCTTSTTELELSRPEKKAYNCLLTVIKRNIVLAECGGSRVDSLLYAKNRKYALEAINNARKACCVTGQFNLEIVRAHLEECILDMRRGHSLHEPHCECNGSYFDVPSLKQMFVTTRSGNCRLLEDTSRVVLEHQIRHVEDAFAGVGGSGGMRTVLNTHDGHIKCDKCERLSVFPFITPCAHMICMDCVCANNQKVNFTYVECLSQCCFL